MRGLLRSLTLRICGIVGKAFLLRGEVWETEARIIAGDHLLHFVKFRIPVHLIRAFVYIVAPVAFRLHGFHGNLPTEDHVLIGRAVEILELVTQDPMPP